MDPESNDVIRNKAAFDTAPDIELCLSLLELHSESIAVPRYENGKSHKLVVGDCVWWMIKIYVGKSYTLFSLDLRH